MSLSLFEIDKRFLEIAEQLDNTDGEASPGLAAEYDNILTDIVKGETSLAIKIHLDSQIEKGKEVVMRIQARIKAMENHQQRLKNKLIEHMELIGKDCIKTDLGTIRLQTSERVADVPISECDEKYIKTEIVKKIDKVQIKKDAKTDNDIKQKYILTNNFIKIY